MSCDNCIELGVPEHLCAFDKEEKVAFDEEEVLYRRIPGNLPRSIEELSAEHLNAIFPLRNDSYNRSKLSNPEDVLVDHEGRKYENHSSISIPIKEVNSIKMDVPDNDKNSRVFSLVVRGDILHCNYSHCEIDCYKNGDIIDPTKNPRASKLFMRDQLKRILKFN